MSIQGASAGVLSLTQQFSISHFPSTCSFYVIDILEPHSADFKDNLGKAKGFAEYARQNPGVGRIQLIRMGKDAAGRNHFRRLDMYKTAIREKVSCAINTDELDHIFDTDGVIE